MEAVLAPAATTLQMLPISHQQLPIPSPPRRSRVSLPPLPLPSAPYAAPSSLRRVLRRLREARVRASAPISVAGQAATEAHAPPQQRQFDCVVELGVPAEGDGGYWNEGEGGLIELAKSGRIIGLAGSKVAGDTWATLGGAFLGGVAGCALVIAAWTNLLPEVPLGT